MVMKHSGRYKLPGYQRRCIDQSINWVNCISKHNNIDDECVPDFSCCFPGLFTKDINDRMESHSNLIERMKKVRYEHTGD